MENWGVPKDVERYFFSELIIPKSVQARFSDFTILRISKFLSIDFLVL